MELSLSILGIDFNHIEKVLKPFEKHLHYLHLDIMDGHFVPNISFGPMIVSSIRKHYSFILDTHLMISEPEKYIPQFLKAGSDIITFHVEATTQISAIIKLIHQQGKKVGLSIKPNTPVEALLPYLSDLDLVLVMSVEPGFGGQQFMEASLLKLKQLKILKEQNHYSYQLSVDGGINDQTIGLVKDYVDLAVCGSYITSAIDPLTQYQSLKKEWHS